MRQILEQIRGNQIEHTEPCILALRMALFSHLSNHESGELSFASWRSGR
jgi:hypothetical protein